jgi:hypothetical protein
LESGRIDFARELMIILTSQIDPATLWELAHRGLWVFIIPAILHMFPRDSNDPQLAAQLR